MTKLDSPNFSQFRLGTSLTLAGGAQVSYTELRQSGLQEHYIRIVHDLASHNKLTREQIDSWVARSAGGDRRAQQAVRNELGALRTPPARTPTPSPPKPGARKSNKAEKVFEMVSSGDHKQALKLAQSYGLHPVRVPERALRPGQSPEAHTVRATEAVASKLITSGWWKTIK